MNLNLKKSDWTLLNAEPIKINTFQDTQVESGKTYYYYLTAIDTTGNISEPSEIVSETAP
jgi:fibronectin type 3 domain-containing protein